MERKLLTADNVHALAQEAAETLRAGNAVVFPTDTIYGLGVDALREDAVSYFFALKRRPAEKPVPLFVRDIAAAKELAFIDKQQEAILEKLWPGPFTVVLSKKNVVSSRIAADTQTVGLRVPDNEFCRALLEAFGGPITASSANISGEDAAADVDAIIKQFKKHSAVPDLFIDTGSLVGRHPSTVLNIIGGKMKILRMGAMSPQGMKEIMEAPEFIA
jgi:L-threonylcarbamoyladenylate synthase